MKRIGALFLSIVAFVALGGLFFVVWSRTSFFTTYLTESFVAAVCFSIALFSITLFQAFDITNRARHMAGSIAKGALASSEELFVKLFQNSPVPYLLIEENGRIFSANMSAVRLFGAKEEDLIGLDIFEHIRSDDEVHAALFSRKFSEGVFITDEEVRVVRPDGSERWVLFSLFSFHGAEHQRQGLLTLVDISKQKQIDQAKSEFVSLASHQLRTPIAAMKWNMELLITKYGERLAAEERAYVEKTVGNLKQMDLLVADFLNVARFELGTLRAEMQPIALSVFFDDIFEEQRAKAEVKHLTVERDEDSELISVTSDAHLLRMIVGNLVSNAVKYTPEGGVIRLSTRRSGSSAVIEVSDTGMGIPLDEQDKLFSKIFRASNAQAQVPDGTGLGLYIVDQAVKVLGGTITFVSAQNKGTTFTVTLPQ